MEVPSYSASACGCLVLWLRLADRLVAVDELVGRFVTVGFRVATVFCAGAFLGVVGVGAGPEVVSLSCTTATSDPSVTSLVTTLVSEGVVSSTTGACCSSSVKVEASVSGEACWFPSE
jgi:hypothetical protein